MSSEDLLGSDYELAEAAENLAHENEGVLTATLRTSEPKKKDKEKAITVEIPEEEGFYMLIEDVRKIRTKKEIEKEDLTNREEALLEAKLKSLTEKIIRKTSGRYGKRSIESIEASRAKALELTAPEQKRSFQRPLNPELERRIYDAAAGALRKTPSSRVPYLEAITKVIEKDYETKVGEIRKRIVATMKELNSE